MIQGAQVQRGSALKLLSLKLFQTLLIFPSNICVSTYITNTESYEILYAALSGSTSNLPKGFHFC